MQAYRSRCKASTAQLSYLAGYMASHGGMASGISQSLQERAYLEKSWENLASKLNSMGGPIKTVPKWKQAWRDLRNNIKKKESHKRKEFCGHVLSSASNGPPAVNKQTQVEQDELSVIGPVAIHSKEHIPCTQPVEHTVNLPDQLSPPPAEPETLKIPLLVLPPKGARLIEIEEQLNIEKDNLYSMQNHRFNAATAQLDLGGMGNGPSRLNPGETQSPTSSVS